MLAAAAPIKSPLLALTGTTISAHLGASDYSTPTNTTSQILHTISCRPTQCMLSFSDSLSDNQSQFCILSTGIPTHPDSRASDICSCITHVPVIYSVFATLKFVIVWGSFGEKKKQTMSCIPSHIWVSVKTQICLFLSLTFMFPKIVIYRYINPHKKTNNTFKL